MDCKEIQPVHSEGDQPWDNPLPSVLVKPCPGRLPRGVGWTRSLTLRADVRLPHVRAYGDNRDRHAAEKGDPSLDPGPCRPSSLARSGSAAPPTSRDLADPVQLRLALHSHPLQGGQVEHSAAADVIIVVPAPVEIVVRELVTSEGERGLSPLPLEPPSHLSPHPTPLGCYQHWFEFPESYSKFPLAM